MATAQLAQCKGKYFGNIIGNSVPDDFGDLWNQVTPENGTKWGIVEATKGVYDWTEADISYNWAKENNAIFKFHTLVWGSQMPEWVETATVEELTESVENYMIAAAEHFNPMGGLDMIDVLNEPANPVLPDYMKDALTAGYRAEPANAYDINNPYGWAIWPYQLARKYFPNSILLTNEYNIEGNWNGMREPYIEIINAIKNARNITDGQRNLIDGVGLQAHGLENVSALAFQICLDEVWEGTGLPLHISEFDQLADPNELKQLQVYSDVISLAWEHPGVAGITLWGYVQGTTWRSGNGLEGPWGTGTGIQYAPTYIPNPSGDRPALAWLRNYMADQPDLYCCPDPAPMAQCIAPQVEISYPVSGTSFFGQEPIEINANATDSDGYVDSVLFYAGSTLIGFDTLFPFTFWWVNPIAGEHDISAIAIDNNGIETVSDVISISIDYPQTFIYDCDNCPDNSWLTIENWTPSEIPSSIDTAVIRFGEVIVSDDLELQLRVEPDGIFSPNGLYSVSVISMQGGMLNASADFSVSGVEANIFVEENSFVASDSVFRLLGNLTGSADITKTGAGVLELNINASEYSGNWNVESGIFQISDSISVGENTVTLSNSSYIHIAASGVYTFNVIVNNASMLLDNDFTVKKCSLDGAILEPGVYTSADYPGAITGVGRLIVLGNRDCFGLEDGTAYIDSCGVCVGGETGLVPCDPVYEQAEDICQFNGIIETEHPGYSGSGYVNVPNAVGEQVTMYAVAYSDDNVRLVVHYANGSFSDRHVKVLVNGNEVVSSFSMPFTGSWASYSNVDVQIPLSAGANKIELVANIAEGISNLDYFMLYGDANFSECPQFQTIYLDQGWNLFSLNVYPQSDFVVDYQSGNITTIFDGLNVDIVKTPDRYWGVNQPENLNSLQNIEPGVGYLVNMNRADTLIVTGIPMPLIDFQYQTYIGWNLIGCPFQSAINITTFFNGIDLSILKNFEGNWVPDSVINSIQDIEVGEAYFLKR